MGQVRGSILEAIGGTPLVLLNRMAGGLKAPDLAKVESLNRGGSVKDRVAAKIEAAEAEGLIRPGGVLIEATA